MSKNCQIPVVLDSPYAGQHLQDHLFTFEYYKVRALPRLATLSSLQIGTLHFKSKVCVIESSRALATAIESGSELTLWDR